jgi:ribosomal protein S15P/S13E
LEYFYFLQEDIISLIKILKNLTGHIIDIEEKIKIYSKDLPILESDTQDIIEYVNQTNKKKKKKFNFWKLLEND